MNRWLHLQLIAAAILIGVALWPVDAQGLGRIYESDEWASVDAQMIVHAKVSKTLEEPQRPSDEVRWCTLELEVLETLKGPAARQLQVACWAQPYDNAIERDNPFPKSSLGKECVIFLDRRERFGTGTGMPGNCGWVVRRREGWYSSRSDAEMEEINADPANSLREPESGDSLLDEVRHFLIWGKQQRAIPQRFIHSSRRSPDVNTEIIYPFSEPFLDHMRRFAQSNPSYFSVSTSTLSPWYDKLYSLREWIDEVLREWGVASPRPIIYEPADWHEPVGRTLIGIAVCVLAWPFGWFVARRRGGSRLSLRVMLGVWILLLTTATGTLWWHSHHGAWSIVWERSRAQWQLASHEGVVRLSRVERTDNDSSPHPIGVVGGLFTPGTEEKREWDLRSAKLRGGWDRFGGKFGAAVPPYDDRISIWVGIVPWWWLAGSLGLMTGFTLIKPMITWNQKRLRMRRGCCVFCGYDLRATPGQCPECGAAAPQAV